jgi:ankyrin repeat protein
MNAVDDTGATPLHWATTGQRLDCVDYFLQKKVNTDIKDCVGVSF